MSADDFQTKYASVMESMLKSAVAETTKLFETMVDELKAEISRIKRENEELKERCSQFESARSQPTVYTRETERLVGRSDGSGKRDTAVQCDLVVVEQCQPLRHSSLQNQKQHRYEIVSALQEHDYETRGEGNSPMPVILVKQEQEEIESSMVCGQVLSNKAVLCLESAESAWASPCGTENEGPFMNTVCSTREMPLPQRHEETGVALEPPFSGTYNGLQGSQNQSSKQGHSLVISLAALKDGMEEESEVSQKIRSEIGTPGEYMTPEKQQLFVAHRQSEVRPLEREQPSVVPQQLQREGETSVNEQAVVTPQQYAGQSTQEQFTQPPNKGEAYDKLNDCVTDAKASSQSDFSVRRRRGRPPKSAKHQQRPVEELLQSQSSNIPTQEEVKKSPTVRVEDVEVSSAVDTVNITSPSQACPAQPKESSSIITPSIQERASTALEDVENISLAVSVASLIGQCSSEKEKTSESQQLSMDVEENAIQAPPAKVSFALTRNTPPAESPQAPTVQPRECHASVTLQDAILLVEAMNQSVVDNTFSSPQRAAPQTQCAPCVGSLQTVDEAPAELQTLPHPAETHEAVNNLPITAHSTTTQSTKEKLGAPPKTTDVTSTNAAQAHIKIIIPKQHTVSLSNTATSSVPPSTQTSVQSLKQHSPYPLITSVAPSRQGYAVSHKIIIVPRSGSSLVPHKIGGQCPTQPPTVRSIVFAAQNDILPVSAAVPQKTIDITSSKSLRVVTLSTTTFTDPQTGTLLHPKPLSVISRQMSARAAGKHLSQTIVLTAQQESAKSAAPAMASSPQFMSLSQELSAPVDTQTTSDEGATISSQKRHSTSDNLESPRQNASVSETVNVHTDTCSRMAVQSVPTSMSPAVQPTSKYKPSAVVRLTRLPFAVSTKESVVVSRLPRNGSCDSRSILKEGVTQEKSSSVVIPTQPSETLVLSADICPSLIETAVAVSVNASQMSEALNDIQEKASVSLEVLPNSGYVQPSTPSHVSQPVFEKSTVAINTTEPSAVSGTAGEPASNLHMEILSIAAQDCTLPNDQPTESAALLNLNSSTSKDTSDPHFQMNKTQFLAHLAVSPVAQNPEKALSNDSADATSTCAETSASHKRRLQKVAFMAQLRSHIKTHLQARRTETNAEPCTEKQTRTVSPKKPRLENDHPNDKNTTSEHIPLSPQNPEAAEDVTSLKKTTDGPTPLSPRRSGLCKEVESFSYSSRRSSATIESTPVSPRRTSSGRDIVGSKNKRSTSVSPRRSSTTKERATPKKFKNISVCRRETSSTRDDACPKTSCSPNNTKSTSVRPKRTSSSRDGASPKRTKSTSVSPRTSALSKNCCSPKMSTSESTSVIRRKCTFTKDGSSTKQIKRESNSFSPRRCSTTTNGACTKNTNSETKKIRGSKLSTDGNSPRKTGESTSVKTPRLIKGSTCTKNNLTVVNAKKLAKAAKAKTVAKLKNYKQSKLQNGSKTSRQFAENRASCEAVRKCTSKAVWTPPKMPTIKAAQARGKRSAHLPVKKETSSPRSKDHPVVYPPSVSLHPIPVKAPPVVSPLQPLSVIGRRLLKNQCGECGRVLSSSAALESHVSLHTGQRPFSCMLCGKRFADSKGLKRHGRVHRNGRIHVCQQCGKGFVYRFGLTKHIQMVHSRIKPFVCQICNKGCFTKLDVEAHIRIHTGEKPFHCNLCEKKFTRRVDLNVHLRWHNGEKRHWCPYCGKGFLDFNNLKRHKYIHTGERPHSCPHCPKHFTQSGHLKKHLRNVHKVQ